jgi:hypothetical protein
MKTATGEIVKSKLTGELYRVKRIKLEKVLLEAEGKPNKAWLGDDESLELFYEKLENERG